MFLYRVALSGVPRWMISKDAFESISSTKLMFPLTNSDLLENEPLTWWKQFNLEEKNGIQISYKQLLSPIPKLPPAVYGLGLNYAAHSTETKMPLPQFPIIIGKAPTALIGPSEPIIIPKVCSVSEVDFEVELAIVIGKKCKNVSKENALDYILGYTCANDVSARKWQGKKGGGQWTRAKSFDTFLPVGPGIQLDLKEPGNTVVRTRLQKKGSEFKVMQESSTKELHFGISTVVEFLSQDTTLLPWTLILTGTPSGVGYTREPPVYLEGGDQVQVEVDGIGLLWNPIQQGI